MPTARSQKPGRPKQPPRLTRKEIDRRATFYRTYRKPTYCCMAEAMDVLYNRIIRFSPCFEAAARWYIIDAGRPIRPTPSSLKTKLTQIRANADKLLAHLGIDDTAAAWDGPGSRNIYDALYVVGGATSEEELTQLTGRIARFVDMVDGLLAVQDLSKLSRDALENAENLRRLTGRRGHEGDQHINYWIFWMLCIYAKCRRVNVRVPLSHEETELLYRFLRCAGAPMGIKMQRWKWLDRVRTVIKQLKKEPENILQIP